MTTLELELQSEETDAGMMKLGQALLCLPCTHSIRKTYKGVVQYWAGENMYTVARDLEDLIALLADCDNLPSDRWITA
jgi:hypothetical protein